MDFDLVVAGGTVVDGSGSTRYRADIGVLSGRVAAIVPEPETRLEAREAIDASGKVVAPGFIDGNSHADWVLPQPGKAELLAPLLLQGVTTVVGGGCGYSPAPLPEGRAAALDELSAFLHDVPFPYRWSSFAEFLSVLEGDRPLVNAAFLVGQNTLRDVVMGARPGVPTRDEIVAMEGMVRQALRDGAYGLSGNLGFRPGRFATDEELGRLTRVVAQEGGVCATHARAYTWISDSYPPFGVPHNLRAIRDLIEIARRSGVRLQVSHLLFAGRRTWRTVERVLAELERAAAGGVDIAFDAVPYTVGNGPLELVFPGWFVAGFPASAQNRPALLRLKAQAALQRHLLGIDYSDITLMASGEPELTKLEGLDFKAIGRALGVGPVDAQVQLARRTGLGAAVLVDSFSGDSEQEEPLRQVLRHPLCSFVTNAAIPSHGPSNPAALGAFSRVLGHFSRDLRLFSLEDAVRRMTSYPAERIGLDQLGRIAEGSLADLVVFDPATVNAPPASNHPRGSGIETVIVSGAVAATGGRIVPGPGHGRILRRH